MIRRILSFSFVSVCLSSCGLWPYKSDFDCPVPEGEQCLSLYETNLKADAGVYAPSFTQGGPYSSRAAKLHPSSKTPSPAKACCAACAAHKPCRVRI